MNKHSGYLTEILAALRAEGLTVDNIKFDGKIYRCPTIRKPNKKNGVYVAHAKPFVRLWYKNWETDAPKIWKPADERELSKGEQKKLAKLMAKIKKAADAEEAADHAKAAIRAQEEYDAAQKCTSHPYLTLKGVSTVPGLKITRSGLLLVLFKDIRGRITTRQTINDDGKHKFLLSRGKKKGSFFRIGKTKEAEALLVCEGLSTGLSLYESCGIPTIVAIDKDNLLPVSEALRTRYSDKKIILCADNDITNDGSANVGIEKASAAALVVNGLVAIPELKSGGKCDFNDLHMQEGKKAVQKFVRRAGRPYGMPEIEPLSRGYFLKPAGKHIDLYYESTRLGRAVYVLAQARDSESTGWGKLWGWHDSDNIWHVEYIPNAQLMGNNALWLGTLANKGWEGETDITPRKLLAQYLVGSQVSRRVLLVSKTGWHKNVYVLPHTVIGDVQGEQPILYPALTRNPYQTHGTLQGWQESIGAWAVGNSRMVLAISATLAGFLLHCYDWAESFGIHFFGISSRGKSTSLQAAASCCGRGSLTGGYIDSWRATANALEGLAAAHSDAPLFLDEMAKASPHVVAEAAYILAGGQEKIRLNPDASMKPVKQWRCIVLSSGEKTFAGKLAEDNIDPMAGQMVRLLDIPAPVDTEDGFVENLHGHNSAGEFVDVVKAAAIKHYGYVAPAFIARLSQVGHDTLSERLQKYFKHHIEKLCDESADGQVKRVAGHFLLCAFAGKLATEWGILPWEKSEAIRAVRKCFKAWLTTRGSTKAMEDEDIINRTKFFIERHGDSRFQTLESGNNIPVRDRVGFKLYVKGQTRYLFLPKSFHKEICKGWDATRVAKVLHRHGLLLRDKDGFLCKAPRDLPDLDRPRCYTVIMPETT